MIVDLFKSEMSLVELSCECGIAKSAINGWIKDVKEIKKLKKDISYYKTLGLSLVDLLELIKRHYDA